MQNLMHNWLQLAAIATHLVCISLMYSVKYVGFGAFTSVMSLLMTDWFCLSLKVT